MKLYFRLSILIAVLLVAQTSANAMFSRLAKEFGETAFKSRLKAVNPQRYFSNAHDSDPPYQVSRTHYVDPSGRKIIRTTYTRQEIVSSSQQKAIDSYKELKAKEDNALKKSIPPYVFSVKDLSSLRDAD
jgi:hypothetical protein